MKCVTTTISEKQYILSEQGTVPNHFFTTSYVIANAVPLLSFPNPNKFKFVPACWSSSTKQTSGRKSSILRLHIQMAYCFRAFLSVLQMTWPYQYLASLRLAHVSSWLPRTRLHRSAPLLNHGLSWAICLHAGELDFWITDDSSNLGSVKAAMPPHVDIQYCNYSSSKW